MYLNELSPDQRRAFLALARQVVDADRRLAIQEVERMDRLYVEAGLPHEAGGAPSSAGDLNLMFDSERSRSIVLIELLLLAYADDTLDPREVTAIRGIAARMELDAGMWSVALDWAERFVALVDEAARFGKE